MNCRDFREIVDSYLSDELLTETNHEVLRHLETCAECRGDIQERRILREKLKSAVKNTEAFQMREGFHQELLANLRETSKTPTMAKVFFGINRNSWMALAACLILAFGLGFWFLQNPPLEQLTAESGGAIEFAKRVSLEDFALGDHQNCAVKFNLTEAPIKINLAAPQYADLRRMVINPLKNSTGKYQLLESHTCKFQGRQFTHIVFRHQGKVVSVLLTDLSDSDDLKNDEMLKAAGGKYQIARFDWNKQAVFVVSDLSERENSSTAELLENSARTQLSFNKPIELNLPTALKINF